MLTQKFDWTPDYSQLSEADYDYLDSLSGEPSLDQQYEDLINQLTKLKARIDWVNGERYTNQHFDLNSRLYLKTWDDLDETIEF